MNINTYFKAIFSRDMNLKEVNYENCLESEDIKAANAMVYLLVHYGMEDKYQYDFGYSKANGGVVYSPALIEDIFEQSNQLDITTIDQDIFDQSGTPKASGISQKIVDFVEYLHLACMLDRKTTSGVISAVQYNYYKRELMQEKRSNKEEYEKHFSARHPKDSYNLGRKVWKSLKAYYESSLEDQDQPE